MKRALAWVVLAALALPASAQTMEPGEWLFTSTMQSPMFPAPTESSFTQCVSEADASDPTRFTARDQAADCRVTPGARTPESYSWTVECPSQGMRGTGTASFRGSTIESEMQVSADMQGQRVELRTRMTGRRVGPCRQK